jgi:hypothetical protein
LRHPLTLARLLLAFLAIVNIYRAATQSITTDEAFTYNRSVVTPIPRLWDDFDANDHVLHTLLCKASVRLFGLSELTLRFPSLLGGFLYFWVCLRLSRRLFGDGWRMLVSVALLTLNPLMLDFCSIARGYGMATALLLFSLYQLFELPHAPWRLYTAGIGLALALAANLTILVPGVALVISYCAIRLLPPLLERQWPRVRARINELVDHMAVPGVVTAFALLLLPMLHARREHFYAGSPNVAFSLTSIAEAVFWRPVPAWYGTWFYESFRPAFARLMALGVFPILLAAIAAASAIQLAAMRKKGNEPTGLDRFLLLAGGAITLSAAALWFGHTFLQAPYPYRRTGLYFVPLVTLASAALFTRYRLHRAGAALTTVVLGSFLLSPNVNYYDEWVFDAGTRRMVRHLRDNPPAGGSLKLATSPFVDHTVRFYQNLYKMDWLEVLPGQHGNIPQADCYLLTADDLDVIRERNLTVALTHPVAQSVLAYPQSTTDSQPRRDKSQ